MLVGLSYELQAFFADNAATEDASTEIVIEIERSQGHFSISPGTKELQSTYILSIDDASLVGYGTLPEHQLGQIVVLAASMCCERVYLSPIMLRRSVPKLTGRTGMFGSLCNILKSGKVETINEDRLLGFANSLVRLEGMTGLPEANLQQGFVSYWWASLSVDPSTRYGHVWAAFEKSVNAYADSDGPTFDQKAAELVGASILEICSLRRLNNRLKHAFRNLGDVQLLDQLRPTVQTKSIDLKRLADTALQKRLKELT